MRAVKCRFWFSCRLLPMFLIIAFAACAKSEQPAIPTDGSQAKTVTIGFTASQTGKLNVESTRQINGLSLWIEQVNAAGGARLADGTNIRFATKFYDDESNKDRVQELYTKLITQDHADFLISPYSSGLADAAAVIAEQNGKVIITAGAASDSTHAKGYSLVYQIYTPASRYLTGALDLLASLDSGPHAVALICEKDKFATEVCGALGKYAGEKGVKIPMAEGYDTGAADFAPFINKIPPTVDVVLGGGHFADGTTFARQLFEKNIKAKFIALLVAPPEPKFAEIGDAAVGIVGPSQWEPQAKYNAALASPGESEWFGPSVEEFSEAYRRKYNEEPSYHSAGGYAAGLVLQKAIAAAGSLGTDKIKAALDNLNLLTFFGRIRFENAPALHGLQQGHEMVYIQWQKNERQELVKQVVWPAEVKSASAVYPIH
ncbi:MAG: ABC transporter substrate-binding protein [Myxococcales bacterium]|nr:ABC transporter substrate-binding protein [Myxococcales bacterium]